MHVACTVKIPSDPSFHGVPRKMLRECALAVGLPEKRANRLELALGEALSNVTRHCYHGACDQPIHVACEVDDGSIRLTLEDCGPQVDTSKLPTEPTPRDQPGGLGLHFIRKTMSEVRFEECPEGGNRLLMIYRFTDDDKETA